jgi:DNA-directed RNA polymerase specialized sigma24 family protein
VHADVAAPPDLVARVADDGLGLGGRIPVDRAEWEARLAALSADDRRLLELVEVEGKSHAEAALVLGLASPAASRKRHSRARHFLRTGTRGP